MNFKDYLLESAKDIDAELEEIFSNWRLDIKEVDPRVLNLLEISIQASSGGKRLRGMLVKLGYELAQNVTPAEAGIQNSGSRIKYGMIEGNKKILRPAAAYEIFQTAILVHDDIIDKSPLRRSKKTIYEELGADHYAISQAICLGDIGFFIAFQMITESAFPDSDRLKAISAFSKTMIDTAFGEMLDVELSQLESERYEEDVITISKYKTAWYTLVGPMQLGASLGGGDEKLLKNIKTFGENLGIAFQIQDDILGIFGSEEVLGKSVTSDITEGKNTLLIVEALRKANSEQLDVLKRLYGKKSVSIQEVEEVQKIFKNTGALDYANTRALEYVTAAKKLIPELTSDKMHRELLEEMADFLVKRDK